MNSVVLGTPCFLAESRWQDYFDDFEPSSERVAIVQELSLQMVIWPSITAAIRGFRHDRSSARPLLDSLAQILQAKSRLNALGIVMDECISQDKDVRLVPAKNSDSPFCEVYDFGTSAVWPAAINAYCGFAFVLENSLRFIVEAMAQNYRFDPLLFAAQAETDGFTKKAQGLIKKTCQINEWAAERAPMIVGISVLSLTAAYLYAETRDLKDWILKVLNQGDEHRNVTQPRFTADNMVYLNKLFTGEADLPSSPMMSPAPKEGNVPCSHFDECTDDTFDSSTDDLSE